MTPLASSAHAVLIAQHDLLQRFGKLGRRADPAQALAAPIAALRASAGALLEQARAEQVEGLPGALELVLAALDDAPTGEASFVQRASWEDRLQDAYDALCQLLTAWGVDLSMHRPPNQARALMHVTTAIVCLLLIEYVLSPQGMVVAAAIGAACCWGMEIGRIFSKRLNLFLLRFMSAVAHPHERREVNSATWYTTALLLLALLFAPKFCAVALVVLGLADPAAAFVGRRWGKTRLINGRSLEGSAAFFVVGSAAALGALALWYPELTFGFALLIATGAALAAAVTELLSRWVDDNLSIPLAAACGAWLVSLAL
jgi:dolichol kinase